MRTPIYALGVAMLFGAAAAPLPTHAATNETFVAPASVLAFDQKLNENQLVVEYVHLPAAGYVAVYGSDSSGMPTGEPLGYTKLEAGDHRQLKIPLKKKATEGSPVWLSLYKDADKDTSFKPGSGDTPVWSKSELPAENRILVR